MKDKEKLYNAKGFNMIEKNVLVFIKYILIL